LIHLHLKLQRAADHKKINYIFFSVCVIALFSISFLLKPLMQFPATFPSGSPKTITESSEAMYSVSSISEMPTKAVHVISVTTEDNNDLTAYWYGGTKEARPDVSLYRATYVAEEEAWQPPQKIMDRFQVTKDTQRMTIIIGNATAIKTQQRILLFFVSVGAGGWAASSINVIYSDDDGLNWSKAKRLISSPFLNISTLVRNPPILVNENLIAIPAYHESLTQYSEMLWVNADGQLINKTRILSGMNSIQPVIFNQQDHFTVLHRSMNLDLPKVIARYSNTGPEGWNKTEILNLPNSDSAMAGLILENGKWLLAYNHAQTKRERMDLAISEGPYSDWSEPFNVEHNPGHNFAYPILVQTPDGLIHLLYTVDRKHFRHIRFNKAWLEENFK